MDLRAFLLQAEDRSARRAARAEHEHARAFQREPPLQRSDHSADIGVESEEAAVRSAHDGVASADAGGELVHAGQRGQNLLLQRHGDGEPGERNALDQGQQIGDLCGFQRQKDSVDALTAKGRVQH